MRQAARVERGFALVLTMLVLVVLGAIVAGSFFAGWLEQQSAERVLFAAQAAEGAEAGLADALLTTTRASLTGMEVGSPSVPLLPLSIGSEVSVERDVRRLSQKVFFIVARATRLDAGGAPLAARSIGLLTMLVADSLNSVGVLQILRDRAWVQLY
jgi:hypothetical protein